MYGERGVGLGEKSVELETGFSVFVDASVGAGGDGVGEEGGFRSSYLV